MSLSLSTQFNSCSTIQGLGAPRTNVSGKIPISLSSIVLSSLSLSQISLSLLSSPLDSNIQELGGSVLPEYLYCYIIYIEVAREPAAGSDKISLESRQPAPIKSA